MRRSITKKNKGLNTPFVQTRGGVRSRFMRMAYIKELWLMAYWNIMI